MQKHIVRYLLVAVLVTSFGCTSTPDNVRARTPDYVRARTLAKVRARTMNNILKKEGEVFIRVNRGTYLYFSADGSYWYTTGPPNRLLPLRGMGSRGTWKTDGRFIVMTGDWQPSNQTSILVVKSWKVHIGFLRKHPDEPRYYEGWIYFEEITPNKVPDKEMKD